MAYSHTKGVTGISGLFDENGNSEINMEKCLKIDMEAIQSTDEQTLHAALPVNALVTRALLKVTTAEVTGTTKTVDIGTATATSGDPNGLFAAQSVAATGIFIGAGALIGTVVTGNDAIIVDFVAADFVEFVGELYIFYIEV